MNIDGIKNTTRTSVDHASPPAKPAEEKKAAEVRDVFFREPEEAKKDSSPQRIDEIASEVQIQLKRLNTELRFDVDRESRDVVVRVIDPETGETIRQIPPDEILAIRERMQDLIGVLYNSET